MVTRFLVTTAIEETWPADTVPVLFLGEWCRLYVRKTAWEQRDAVAAPYHWDNREKLYQDYLYLQTVYESSLESLTQTGKPLILSTGMSTTEEAEVTVAFLNKRSAQFALLHCNSTYPAPLHDINLKWMPALRHIHPLVGYSGHERGINVSLAAVALDACIIERHFTLDRTI